ncbi:MAG TPA: hypothetical protein PLW65_02200 [Pseudomonadota bacterium]|nr:hypothetical protein [Pseudomonadota bacterium]
MRIESFIARQPGRWSGALRRCVLLALIVTLSGAGAPSGGCKPADDPSCAGGVACSEGQRCVLGEEDGQGMCVTTCDSSKSCGEATPVCDRQELFCRTCFPGEDAPCQLRDPQHPRCGGGHCVGCLSPRADSAQATECQGRDRATPSLTPVCDQAQSTCRACQRHSECDSGVCAKDGSGASFGVPQGSCVPVEQVMVVNQELCTSDGPVFCTLKQALAQIDMKRRYIVVRKSAVASDFSDVQIGNQASHQQYPITLIGPLADGPPTSVSSPPLVNLGGDSSKDSLTITSSRVVVEGFPIRDGKAGIACQGAGAQVRVVRSFLSGNDTALLATAGCSLTVEQCWFGRGPDSSVFRGSLMNARTVDVTASDFWVINSVLADNGDPRRVEGFGGVRVRSLSVGSRSRSGILNSTFLQQNGLVKFGKRYQGVLCDVGVGDRLVVMNTLLWSDANLQPEEHYIDSMCGASLHHNASNDPALNSMTADKSLVLPMDAAPFASATTRDLHLGPRLTVEGRSPSDSGLLVLDLAPDRILAPTTDMDGRPRAQAGGTISIGAYEPAP